MLIAHINLTSLYCIHSNTEFNKTSSSLVPLFLGHPGRLYLLFSILIFIRYLSYNIQLIAHKSIVAKSNFCCFRISDNRLTFIKTLHYIIIRLKSKGYSRIITSHISRIHGKHSTTKGITSKKIRNASNRLITHRIHINKICEYIVFILNSFLYSLNSIITHSINSEINYIANLGSGVRYNLKSLTHYTNNSLKLIKIYIISLTRSIIILQLTPTSSKRNGSATKNHNYAKNCAKDFLHINFKNPFKNKILFYVNILPNYYKNVKLL